MMWMDPRDVLEQLDVRETQHHQRFCDKNYLDHWKPRLVNPKKYVGFSDEDRFVDLRWFPCRFWHRGHPWNPRITEETVSPSLLNILTPQGLDSAQLLGPQTAQMSLAKNSKFLGKFLITFPLWRAVNLPNRFFDLNRPSLVRFP